MTQKSSLSGAIFGLLAFAMFAAHDVVVKILGGTLPVFQIIFFTALFSIPLLLGLMAFSSEKTTLMPRHPWWITVRTLVSVGTMPAIFYAVTVLPLAVFYTVMFTIPLWVTAMSVIFLGEPVGVKRWAAVLIGFLGILVVIQPGAGALTLGHLAGLSGAFGAAFIFVTLRKIGNDENTVVLMIYPMLAHTIVTGALMVPIYRPMALADFAATMALAVLSFAATMLIIAAYRRAKAVVVAPMQYSQILWAVFYGAVLFGDVLEIRVAIGAAIIIASGIFIVWRENRLVQA